MAPNKFLPHVLILPEDDANQQLVNGFLLHHCIKVGKVQPLEVAGGWIEVLERFRSEHLTEMERFPERRMILLIDFDGNPNRRDKVREIIPQHLLDRVFVLGTLTEPEELRASIGSYESIGQALARDCCEGMNETWNHDLLNHNAIELARLRVHVRPILCD